MNLADGFTIPPPGADGSAARIAELILAILAWAAEMELLTRRERIAAPRELADERGEPWGRPSRLTPATRDRIAELRAAGLTVREVAARMKCRARRSGACLEILPSPRPWRTGANRGASGGRLRSKLLRQRALSDGRACGLGRSRSRALPLRQRPALRRSALGTRSGPAALASAPAGRWACPER